jgi:hypothetical protein
MITKDNEPIYRSNDGDYTIHVNGQTYGVCNNNPAEKYTIDMVEAYLAEHPEALVPEPVPEPPTPEELAARRRVEIMAELAAIDASAIRPMRAKLAGSATVADEEMIADLEAQAVALRGEAEMQRQ